jgi:hypothetical protein
MDRTTMYKVLEEVMEGDGPAAREAARQYEKMQEEDSDAVSQIADE